MLNDNALYLRGGYTYICELLLSFYFFLNYKFGQVSIEYLIFMLNEGEKLVSERLVYFIISYKIFLFYGKWFETICYGTSCI